MITPAGFWLFSAKLADLIFTIGNPLISATKFGTEMCLSRRLLRRNSPAR
jgi:hypothetical protein